ncbi:MAG: heme ABC exporter ATP-binding protein CcmA [Acidimicrobiaceae bacterium]|nr:heme ABC exporter ATP-binding protein CcmA [Acidimicrobiaceae bacterium]HAY51429.1 heme ABC exporter ATP-binding protein CcmA [Acidimicrobiaceae bacterium]
MDLQEAVVTLGQFPALTGVTLKVAKGEIVTIKGPNGAGKSTLLRLCAGLLPVREGSAYVLGENLNANRRAIRQDVGLLGHKTGLYEDLTVEENVAFWGSMVRAGKDEINKAIKIMGVDGRLRKVLVRQLSAGQRRRTSFAGLVVQRPSLWLLDEPHAALDTEGRDLVDNLIQEAAASGATVLLVSHAPKEVSSPSPTRIVAIAGGRITSDIYNEGSGDGVS